MQDFPRPTAIGWRTGSWRRLAPFLGVLGWMLLSFACSGGGQAPVASRPAGTGPLGWRGPVEALEVRRWTARSIEEAQQWRLAEAAVGVLAVDSVHSPGQPSYRPSVGSGVIFPGRQLLIALSSPNGRTEILAVESAMLLQAARRTPPPRTTGVWPRMWSEGARLYLIGDEAVASGDLLDMGPPVVGLGIEEVLYLGPDGRLTRPVAHVDPGAGRLVGALRDGTLLYWNCCEAVASDTTVVASYLLAHPTAATNRGGTEPTRRETVFTVAAPRDPEARDARPRDYRWLSPATAGVWGDTIWVVPSERPELVALDRSGEVLLRVDWAAGRRVIPSESRQSWGGLERFPAASALFVGTDGLVYVQLWTLGGGRPARGPGWLVFGPAGELVARLEIPRSVTVLAFGAGSVLVTQATAAGLREIRLHAIDRPS